MKKFKLIAAALLASTMPIMVSCGDEPTATISAVKITNKSDLKSIYTSLKKEVKINVSASGGAEKTVEISSSDTSILKVKKSAGKFYAEGVKEGKATLTVTSIVDDSKLDSVEIEVVYGGFDPTFIEDGFTFEESFPTDVIEGFLGDGEYEIVEAEVSEGGCYYQELEDDGEYPAQVIIALDGLVNEDYFDALTAKGFTQYCYDDYGDIEVIDPTKTYTVSISCEYDDYYEPCAPTYLYFLKNSDVWGSDVRTTDTAWNQEIIEEVVEYYGCLELTDIMAEVPFVALGEDYFIEPYVYMGFYLLPNTAVIYDYSLDTTFLDGYKDVLIGAGFEEKQEQYEGETYLTYEKAFGEDGLLSIDFEWAATGNTINAMVTAKELNAYPEAKISTFVSEILESEVTIPTFGGVAESYSFLKTPYGIYDNKGALTGRSYTAEVTVNGTTKSAFEGFLDSLEVAGFTVEVDDSYLAYYGEIDFTAVKGEVALSGSYYAKETLTGYSSTNGDFSFEIGPTDMLSQEE